jgi:hypothetical protein
MSCRMVRGKNSEPWNNLYKTSSSSGVGLIFHIKFNYITPFQKTEILAVRRFVIVVSLSNAELQNGVKDDAWRRGAMMYLWRYE